MEPWRLLDRHGGRTARPDRPAIRAARREPADRAWRSVSPVPVTRLVPARRECSDQSRAAQARGQGLGWRSGAARRRRCRRSRSARGHPPGAPLPGPPRVSRRPTGPAPAAFHHPSPRDLTALPARWVPAPVRRDRATFGLPGRGGTAERCTDLCSSPGSRPGANKISRSPLSMGCHGRAVTPAGPCGLRPEGGLSSVLGRSGVQRAVADAFLQPGRCTVGFSRAGQRTFVLRGVDPRSRGTILDSGTWRWHRLP